MSPSNGRNAFFCVQFTPAQHNLNDWAAGDDVSNDFCPVIGGVDDARSFGIVGNHAADFSAGAEATNYAADGGLGVAEWIMPEGGTVG